MRDRKWLTGWIIAVNALVILFIVNSAYTGHVRDNQLRTLLQLGKVPMKEEFRSLLVPVLVVLVLLIGIVAELKHSRLSLMINPGLFMIGFVISFWKDLTYHGAHPNDRVIARIVFEIPCGLISFIGGLLIWIYFRNKPR